MKKTLLALPALAILLGVGGAGTAYAHGLAGEGLTEEQQASYETLKELMHDGKIEEAKAFAAEAGLPNLKHGKRLRLDPEKQEAIQAALDAADYSAFAELTAEAPFADELTPENFSRLVEAHTLMEAGDMEGARAILDEVGVRLPMVGGQEMKRGFNQGTGHWQRELTDEQQDLLDQAKKLHQSGDEEGARAIIEELDLPHPPAPRFER
ncbi:MAG: hypothetical protein WAZ14_03290 [Patescibacteria group bacterium]